MEQKYLYAAVRGNRAFKAILYQCPLCDTTWGLETDVEIEPEDTD